MRYLILTLISAFIILAIYHGLDYLVSKDKTLEHWTYYLRHWFDYPYSFY